MPPRGGLADKIGNRYEGRIAVRRILQLLDEQHDSVRVRFEEPGDHSFKWWVQWGIYLASVRRSSDSIRWMRSGPSERWPPAE